jgi:hypothetical protein
MAPLVAVVAAALPLAVASLAPGFTAAAAAAAIFLVGGVAAGGAQLVNLGVIAANRQWLTLWITGIGLVINLLAAGIVLQFGFGLTTLATTAVGVRIAHLTALVFILDMGRRQRVRMALALAAPLAWCAALVTLVGASGPTIDLQGLILALAGTALGLVPLVLPAYLILKNAAIRTKA